jgi:hypothetical protein
MWANHSKSEQNGRNLRRNMTVAEIRLRSPGRLLRSVGQRFARSDLLGDIHKT